MATTAQQASAQVLDQLTAAAPSPVLPLVYVSGVSAAAVSGSSSSTDAAGVTLALLDVNSNMAGANHSQIAAGTATNTTIKASAGRLCRVIVTATGTNAMQFQDNAVTVASLPASPTVGAVFEWQIPCGTNIVAVGAAANPGVTVIWS